MSFAEHTNILNLADELLKRKEFAEADERARFVLQELLSLNADESLSAGPLRLHAHALCIVSACQTSKNLNAEALEQYARAFDVAVAAESPVFQSRAMSGTAQAQARLGEYRQALENAHRSLAIAESASDVKGQALALSIIGSAHKSLSNYTEALAHMQQALAMYEELNDAYGVSNQKSEIGSVYFDLSDFSRALEYFREALSSIEKLGEQTGKASACCNIGLVHHAQSDYSSALEYYQKALDSYEERGNARGVSTVCSNMGTLFYNLSEYSRAMEYYQRARSVNESIGFRGGLAGNVSGIGLVYLQLADYDHAIEYLQKAIDLNETMGNRLGVARDIANLGSVHVTRSEWTLAIDRLQQSLVMYEMLGNLHGAAINISNIGAVYEQLAHYDEALVYYERALALHESLGETAAAAVGKVHLGAIYSQEDFIGRDEKLAERYLQEGIQLSESLGTKHFESYYLLSELYLRQERWKESRAFYVKYHTTKEDVQSEEAKKTAILAEQVRQIAEREKEIVIAKTARDAKLQATTSLLHKVLPQSIATRMIDGEEEIADYFAQASILFADIAGFTPISSNMPAHLVVRFLNHVFHEFDIIMTKHGCEKIKTIGDGYMAIAGAPIPCDDHAERLLAAAVEMQNIIHIPDDIRAHIPAGTSFGVRIGLHTGAIVGGVIGESRFVYDVYSDAVNVASRMESHGAPHRIHVSADFVRHLHSRSLLHNAPIPPSKFESRGEIEIKGKGKMQTYFLDRA